MYYTIYKTTNLVNGKFYIGAHKTSNIDDDYLGSGKLIVKAIEKYGRHSFKKEVLEVLSSKEEMFQREKEIVTENTVNDRNSYNVKPGGIANYYYVNANRLNHKVNQHLKFGEKLSSNSVLRSEFVDKMTRINKANVLTRKPPIRTAKNTKWMSNDNLKSSKQVDPNQIEEYISNGWYLGLTYRKRRSK